jgi:hypothetical protein
MPAMAATAVVPLAAAADPALVGLSSSSSSAICDLSFHRKKLFLVICDYL